jgi:hypothetical protein
LSCYLFSYFNEPNGTDGLHLAWSRDGLAWTALKNDRSFVKPEVDSDKLMRDPFVLAGPDGVFRLVWTTSWRGKGIGYASSEDLLHWSKQRHLPVMEHEPYAKNTWAPEIVYDEERRQYVIFWSSTVPGRRPESDGQSRQGPPHPGLNNRIYFAATRNFETFSHTAVLHDPGFNAIDACIRRDSENGRYVMFFKDETALPFKFEKNVRVAFSKDAVGPYGPASGPITGGYWCEGPSALKAGDMWYVYTDRFLDRRYGAVASKDLKVWEDVSDRLRMPEGAKHGTAFEVSEDVLERLFSV